jgi:hypothetical protein
MLLVRCGSGVRGIYANHITIWVNAERSCCATSARTDRPTTTGRDGFAPNACRRQPPAVPPYLTPFLFPAREYHKHEPGCASDEPQAARGLRVRHDSRVAFWRKRDKNFRCRTGPVEPRFQGFAGRGSGGALSPFGSPNPGSPLSVKKQT